MFLLSILYLQKIQNTSFCLLWEQLQEKVILSYGILPQVFCRRQKFSTFLRSCHLMSVPFWSAHLFKSICTEFKNMDFFLALQMKVTVKGTTLRRSGICLGKKLQE